jgi:hypothetical protein
MDDYEEIKEEPSFSLQDFKKWMSSQNDQPKSRHAHLVGLHVESKLSIKRLVNKIIPDDEADVNELAKEFRRDGGVILQIDEDCNLLIEVDSGTFTIPRYFVRKT